MKFKKCSSGKQYNFSSLSMEPRMIIFTVIIPFFMLLLSDPAIGQRGRYWDQNLNSEAALLSGAVVAGEGGIAAIYYNPATIPEMKRNNLSLSANLFSVYYFNAKDALGTDVPADRTQLDIYPRIITLTLKPKKKPDLTIEIAYFTKANEYMQINRGTSQTGEIIGSNPGNEDYTGDYYLRSKFEDYYGGAGFGYKLSNDLSLGFSGLISYKSDQFYNLVSSNAFTMPVPGIPGQYLADASYHMKYNVYDVRFIPKLGLHVKKHSWAIGANINFPSIKLFGNGTVLKEYKYSNIHTDPLDPEASNLYYSGRQKNCTAHFKDPMSIAAGANFYSPSGRSILLFTAEYFFKIPGFNFIEAHQDPGEEGYNFTPFEPQQWLSFTTWQKPVLNAGVAFKRQMNDRLWLSAGFRTDFNYTDKSAEQGYLEANSNTNYAFDVYHLNYGLGSTFKRGAITLGMQFSYAQANNQRQIVNLTEPVEYVDDKTMPLTGPVGNQVQIRYLDISVYLGFQFNFMKDEQKN